MFVPEGKTCSRLTRSHCALGGRVCILICIILTKCSIVGGFCSNDSIRQVKKDSLTIEVTNYPYCSPLSFSSHLYLQRHSMGGSSSKVEPTQKIVVSDNALSDNVARLERENADLKKELNDTVGTLQKEISRLQNEAVTNLAATDAQRSAKAAAEREVILLQAEVATLKEGDSKREAMQAATASDVRTLGQENADLKGKIAVMKGAGGNSERRRRPRTGGPTLEPRATFSDNFSELVPAAPEQGGDKEAAATVEVIAVQHDDGGADELDVASVSAPSDGSDADNRAATTIQAGWRGRQARKEVDGLVEEQMIAEENSDSDDGEVDYKDPLVQRASVTIQSGFRGMRARKEVAQKRAEQYAEEDDDSDDGEVDYKDPLVQRASVTIQSGFRGMRARKEVAQKRAEQYVAKAGTDEAPLFEGIDKNAELSEEHAARADGEANEFDADDDDDEALELLEAAATGHLTRSSAIEKLNAIQEIQALLRGELARKKRNEMAGGDDVADDSVATETTANGDGPNASADVVPVPPPPSALPSL